MEFTITPPKNQNSSRKACIKKSKTKMKSKTKFLSIRNSIDQMMNEPKRTKSIFAEKEKRSNICVFTPNNSSQFLGEKLRISTTLNKKSSRTPSNSIINSISSEQDIKQLVEIYNINDNEYVKNEHPDIVLNFNKVKDCSFIKYGIKESLKKIKYAYCKTCDSNLACPICIPCINICHKGHIIKHVSHKGYIKCVCAEKKHQILKNSNNNNIIECLCNEWAITSKLNIYYINENGDAICEMCHCYCDAKSKNFKNQVNLSNISNENKVNIPNCTCKNELVHGDKKKLFEITLKLINDENIFNIFLHPVQFINMIFKSKQSFNTIFEPFIIFDQKLKSSNYEVFLNYLYKFSNIDLTSTNIYKCIVIIEKIIQKIENKYVCFYCEEIRNFFSFNVIKKLFECIDKSSNIITEKFRLLLIKEYLYLFNKIYINYNVLLLDKYKINDLKNLSFLQRILIFRENSKIFLESDDIINFLIKRLKNINIKGFSCIESLECIKEIYSILRKLSNYFLISNRNMLKIAIEILNSFNLVRILRKLFIKDNQKNTNDIKNKENYKYFSKIALKLYYTIIKMLLNFIYTYNDKISYKIMQNKENIDITSENIGFIYKKNELGRLISKITIVILTISQKHYEKSNDKRNNLVKRFGMGILQYYLNKDDNYMINLLRSINYYKNYSGWENILTDTSKHFYEIENQKERISKAYYRYFNFELNTLELYKIINDSLNKVLGKLTNNIYSIYEEKIEKGFSFNKNIEIIKTNYFYIILKVLDIIYYNNYQNIANKEKEQSSFKYTETTFGSNSLFKKTKGTKKPNSNKNSSISCYENQIITKIIYFYFCFVYNSSENSFFILSYYFINELIILPVKYSKLIFKLFYTCINNIAKIDNNIIVSGTHIVKKLYNYLEFLLNAKINDDNLLICIHYFLQILQITTFNLRTSFFNILLYRIQLILLSLNNKYNLVSKFYEMKESEHIIRIEEVFIDKDESIKDLFSEKGNSFIAKSTKDIKYSGITNLTKTNKSFKTNIQILKNTNVNMTNLNDLSNLNNINNPKNNKIKIETLNKCFIIYITLVNDCFDFSMNDDRKKINKIIKIDKVIFALKNYKLNLDLRTEFLRFIRKMIIDIQYSTNDNDLYSKAIIENNDNLSYIKNNPLISNLKYPTKLLSFSKDFYNISAKRSIQEKVKSFYEHLNNDVPIIENNTENQKIKKFSELNDINEDSDLKNSQINEDIYESDITHHRLIAKRILTDDQKNEKINIKKSKFDFDSLQGVIKKSPIIQKRYINDNDKNIKLYNNISEPNDNNESQEDDSCRIKLYSNVKSSDGKKKDGENEEKKIDENEEEEGDEKVEKKENEKNKDEDEEKKEEKNDQISQSDSEKKSVSSKTYSSNSASNYNSSNNNSKSKKTEQSQKKEIDDNNNNDSEVIYNIVEKCSETESNKIIINIDNIIDNNKNIYDNEKNVEYSIKNNLNTTTTKKNILKKSNTKFNDNIDKNNNKLNEKEKKKVGFIVDSEQENQIEQKKNKKKKIGVLKMRKTLEENSEESEKNMTNINKYNENATNSNDESNIFNLYDDQLNKTSIKENLIESSDEKFYEVLQYELENLIINTQDIELNNPEDNDKLRNYFENGLLIPIIYFFKKIFSFIQDFTGNDLIKLYTLVEKCISLKLYISGFKFDFWREQIDESNTIYLDSSRNLNGIHSNKISINLQNYGKTNIIKKSIIDGSCFIDTHSMELTFESLDYIKSGKTSLFDYTALYQIIDQEFFSLIKDRKKTDIDKMFEEESNLEITNIHSLKKEFILYRKKNGIENNSMEMNLVKIFIMYKYNKQICFHENSFALFSILSEICYGYETSYRNLLIELLINNGKNLDFKNEFTDTSYFLLYKLLSFHTYETQTDIIYLLGGQYSSEIGFLNQFSQNLFNRIVLLFIDYLNPPDKIMQSNYFIAFNLIKILKYLCEGHNKFFQRHLIKSLAYFYVDKIPSFYRLKIDNKNNDDETITSNDEETVLEKYFEDINNTNKDCRYSIKFFDFFLFTLTKLILISNWAKKSFKDENKQTPYFYDLFFSILELLTKMIQGNKAEILSTLCENINEEIKEIFGDNFILPEFNNKLSLSRTNFNTQLNEEKNDAFEVFVKECIVLIFKQKNNLELMYKIKHDIMKFFISLLEDKNVNDNMKKIINKHLNINKVFAKISDILKSYYLCKNSAFEKVKTQDINMFKKRHKTNFIYRKSKFTRRKSILKLQALDHDKSIIPLINTTTFLQPIKRPDINEIIKMHNKIYIQKYGNEQTKKKKNQSKNNYLNINNNNNLLNNKKIISNSNCNFIANSTCNNLGVYTEDENDLSKTENSRNSQILESDAISALNYKNTIAKNNRISQIMETHKTYNRNFKMIEINRSDTINFLEKLSKITLENKLYNYFKIEFYENETFNKTIEFKLTNIFYRYIKLIDIQQKNEYNNSFIEEIIKMNEEFLNVDSSQIAPSEFEEEVNFETFEFNSQYTLKINNSSKEKTFEKDLIEKYYIVKFFENITTTVEIRTSENKYQTVIFTNLPEMKYLSEGTKLEFEKNVNRDNETSKKMDLLRYIEYFIKEIEINKNNNKNFKLNFLNKIDFYYLEVLMYIYILFTNLLILFVIDGDIQISNTDSQKKRRQSRKNIQNLIEMSVNNWDKIYRILSCVYILVNLLLIFFWLKLKLPLYYQIDKIKYKERFKISAYKKLSSCNKLYVIIKMSIINRKSLLYLIYEFIICLLSLLIQKGEIILAFLLLPIIGLNNTLNGILISIQLRYKELLLTFFLATIVMYVFSSFAFFLNNSDFESELDYYQDNYCKTLIFSFLNTIDSGLRARGGLGDSAKRISFLRNKNHFIFRTILDDAFFMLIVIIMIDMVFGIIIQSFVELRNKLQKYKSDESNHCFICHVNKNILEKNKLNFHEHIKNVHNLWNYVEYIISLKFKKKQELNDIDNYTKIKINNKDISWLPTYKNLNKQNFGENMEYNNSQNKLVVPDEKTMHYKLREEGLDKANKNNKLLFIEGLNYYFQD